MKIVNNFFNIRDKVVIITGASKGLGKGMAELFAEAGAKTYLISRTEKELKENVAAILSKGGSASYIAGNVNDIAFIDRVVTEVMEKENRIDILINNAGMVIPNKALEVTEKDWDATIDTNLKSVFFFSQAVGKCMKEQKAGKIINIASVMGTVADIAISPYCASKGGVIQLTKALALEWARYNIQVNAIGPGYVRTDMNDDAFKDEKYHNYILSKTPLKKLGTISQIAGTALFLASPVAEYITGQTIFVDGGWTAQ
jgi:NAD(P)-dependent dehydrogenase (short-subunit alcohol dehydrogenase family)